ncbi:MAG: fructosamine kinase family protein [Chloroflexota bacterium]
MTQDNPTISSLIDIFSSNNVGELIESEVSAYLGRRWQITNVEDKQDEASHPAALLSDSKDAIFVKLGQGNVVNDQLLQEAAGLRLLSERGKVRTPSVIGVVDVNRDMDSGGDDNLDYDLGVGNDRRALLIMEAVQVIPRKKQQWREIGQALAQIHSVKADSFGLASHCYWGDLYQDNTPHENWPDFFWRCRVEPRLKAAVDSGNLPLPYVPRVESIGNRLADLCGPIIEPSLLHGDAHQNNFISTHDGAVLIDPAVYYGHPEIDLAHVDFFAPVPDALFDGYQEIAPIDAGFTQRRDLWRLPSWLAMVQVDGVQHLETLDALLL